MPWLPRIAGGDVATGDLVAGGSFSVIYKGAPADAAARGELVSNGSSAGEWRGIDVAIKKLFDPRVTEEQSAEFEREIRILGYPCDASAIDGPGHARAHANRPRMRACSGPCPSMPCSGSPRPNAAAGDQVRA
jgi:hypothetical protein